MNLSRRGLLGLFGGAAVAATGAQAKPLDMVKVEPATGTASYFFDEAGCRAGIERLQAQREYNRFLSAAMERVAGE